MKKRRFVPGFLFLWILLQLLLLPPEEEKFDADCGVVSDISAIVTPRFALALSALLLLVAVAPLIEAKKVLVLFPAISIR